MACFKDATIFGCTLVLCHYYDICFGLGFAKQLILFATFPEVKSHNPLVKNLKLTQSNEDFELKKLLINMMQVLCRDQAALQVPRVLLRMILKLTKLCIYKTLAALQNLILLKNIILNEINVCCVYVSAAWW